MKGDDAIQEDEDLLNQEDKTLKSVSLLNSDTLRQALDTPSWHDFEVLEKLGEGSYGKIFKVRERYNDKRVLVIKQIDRKDIKRNYDMLAEINVMARMDNPNIVKYHDSFTEGENKVNIIMEFCEKGDLHKLLKKRKLLSSKQMFLSENVVWNFFIQICVGLYHMHSEKILHRDLKTLNIFLTKDNKIKIGDLGVAKILEDFDNFVTSKVGTPYYLSPEVCEDRPYNSKSDIWSLGCILYELCTLAHPFEAKNQAALLLKIIKGKYESIPKIYSRSLAEIVHSCLMKDFKKRPSVKSILQLDIVQTKAQLLKIHLPIKRQDKQDLKTNDDVRTSLGGTIQPTLNKSLSQDKTPRVSEKPAAPKKKSSIVTEKGKESPTKKGPVARSRNSSFFSSSNSQSSRENAALMPCMRGESSMG